MTQPLQCRPCEVRRKRWEDVVASRVAGRGDGRNGRFALEIPGPAWPSAGDQFPVRATGLPYRELRLWLFSTVYLMHCATGHPWDALRLRDREAAFLRRSVLCGRPGPDLVMQVQGRLHYSTNGMASSGGMLHFSGVRALDYPGPAIRSVSFHLLDIGWTIVLERWPRAPVLPDRLKEDGSWLLPAESKFEHGKELLADMNFQLEPVR